MVQVKARFRDWAGLLDSYSVVDQDNRDVPFELPADKVCMHFFPGSRVDIKGECIQQASVAVYCACCLSICHFCLVLADAELGQVCFCATAPFRSSAPFPMLNSALLR